MQETIKDIEGYEKRYAVSDLGIIYSYPNKFRKGIRILKQDVSKRKYTSYRRVTFSLHGKTKRFSVHRLVGKAFIPNPDNKKFINHIDNNGENNIVSNLEWCTHKENMKHSAKQGRQDKVKHLGGIANGKIQNKKAKCKIKILLRHRLIDFVKVNKRLHVKFKCKYCGNIFIRRTDSPWIQRGGICTDCYRE